MTLSEVLSYTIILVCIYAFIQFFFYKKHNGYDFNSNIQNLVKCYQFIIFFIESVTIFTR